MGTLLFFLIIIFGLSPCLFAQDSVFVIGQDTQSIDDYMETCKNSDASKVIGCPDGIMVYTAINDLRGLAESVDHGAGMNCADQLLRQYPQFHVVQIGLYMRYFLDETANGGFDNNIDQLGQWIKSSGKQVYLRIGYEFDNPENMYDPRQYISAYRHIVDRMKENNVRNVKFVWHSIAWRDNDWPAYDPLKWYPGDQYVDWIGLSFFDVSRDEERNTIAAIAKTMQKPLMVAESSPFKQNFEPEKIEWIERLFQYMHENQIKFLSYINVNWDNTPMFADQKWGDARLQNVPILLKKWRQELEQF